MLLRAGFLAVVLATATEPTLSPDQYPAAWTHAERGTTTVLYRKHGTVEMSQGPVGSCVGCATAKALEMMHGIPFSPEWIYGISREHFGKADSKGQGSYCGWAAHVVKEVGVLPSRPYHVYGFDLTEYDAGLAYSWARGPPDALEWESAYYRSPGYVRIRTWEQLRGAISNEIPVIVGSSVGFGTSTGQVRSADGKLRSRWWSRWHHAMLFCGVSDKHDERALLLNSWGNHWISGPKWLGDEPDGSFWASRRDAEKLLERGDAWAILPIVGL